MNKRILTTLIIGIIGINITGCTSINPTKNYENSKESFDKEMSEVKKIEDKQRAQRLAKELAAQLLQVKEVPVKEEKKIAVKEKKINLKFQNANAAKVYQALIYDTSYNLVLGTEVQNIAVSLDLKNTTVNEALDILRDVYGFEYEIKGNRLEVSKPEFITRTFQVNYLLGQRQGRTEVKVVSGSVVDSPSSGSGSGTAFPSVPGQSGGQTRANETSRITTTVTNDFWAQLTTALQSILNINTTNAGNKQIIVNSQSGLVFVKATPKEMREIAKYLSQTQNAVAKQVMLEAKILEVSFKDGAQTGVNWALFDKSGLVKGGLNLNNENVSQRGGAKNLNNFQNGENAYADQYRRNNNLANTLPFAPGTNSLAGNAGVLQNNSSMLGLTLNAANFTALINFLETQGNVSVLSSPRVATLNNQKAVLKVGTDEFFVTNVSTSTTTSGSSSVSSPSISVQPFFSGIALDVTPQVDERGVVTLHIHPSVSDVSEKSKVINLGALGTYTLPLASSSINETDAIVRINNGDIVAIGGLMKTMQQSGKSQVPLLGDIPGGGNLFKQTSKNTLKSELVILIKPTVIEN